MPIYLDMVMNGFYYLIHAKVFSAQVFLEHRHVLCLHIKIANQKVSSSSSSESEDERPMYSVNKVIMLSIFRFSLECTIVQLLFLVSHGCMSDLSDSFTSNQEYF